MKLKDLTSAFFKLVNKKYINGQVFYRYSKTASGTHCVGYSKKSIVKVELSRNPKKLLSLDEEADIISWLNEKGCVSCPRLLSRGKTIDNEPYMIVERIYKKGNVKPADYIFSLLEQKSLGCYQGDFKPANMIFDGNICYLIDYDQAQKSEQFISMQSTAFIDWIASDFFKRRKEDFWTNKERMFNRNEIMKLFKNGSFSLNETSLLQNQTTTDTVSGIYHTLECPEVHTTGSRTISDRKLILDRISFEQKEKILDIGCNLGLLSMYFDSRGCCVTGVDMDWNVIQADKMINHIIGKDITFKCVDMATATLTEKYDTITLFSVFHHIANIDNVSEYIRTHANRVILECKLVEGGSVPIKGHWQHTNSWKFESPEELIEHMEKVFSPMKFEKNWGKCDRERYIFTFVKE